MQHWKAGTRIWVWGYDHCIQIPLYLKECWKRMTNLLICRNLTRSFPYLTRSVLTTVWSRCQRWVWTPLELALSLEAMTTKSSFGILLVWTHPFDRSEPSNLVRGMCGSIKTKRGIIFFLFLCFLFFLCSHQICSLQYSTTGDSILVASGSAQVCIHMC